MTPKHIIERVKKLYKISNSTSGIAKKLGLTHRQVAGIVWREIKHKTPKKKPKPLPKEPAPRKKPNRLIKIPVLKNIPLSSYVPSNPVHMSRLSSTMCTEIIGETKNLMCCGERIERGSYCKRHAAINYQS